MARCVESSAVSNRTAGSAMSALLQYSSADSDDDDTMDVDVEAVACPASSESVSSRKRPAVGVALPDVCSASDDNAQKRRRCSDGEAPAPVLPLPDAVKHMFSHSGAGDSGGRGPDTGPEDHQGRVRSFAHVRGNWASYVYVPCSPSPPVLGSVVQTFLAICSPAMQLTAVQEDCLHISLTRTVVFKHHWIDQLMQSARRAVTSHKRFDVALGEPAVYMNDDSTRTFLGLTATVGSDRLAALSSSLDQCLAEYGLPPFYQNASFHVSVAWCVGDASAAIQRLFPQLKTALDEFRTQSPLVCRVDALHCKCGNKLFTLPLR